MEPALGKFIAKEQEDFLWENGSLKSENGKNLCFNLVWVFGIQFALRTGQEHRNLEVEKFFSELVRVIDLQRSVDYHDGLPK